VILLDTNVVSELLRRTPDATMVGWLNSRFSECAVSSVSVFEINVGIASMPRGRDALQTSVSRIFRRFGPRKYAFDTAAAHAAAKLLELARARGLGLHQLRQKFADLQIAGIAAAYGLGLATRNVADFEGVGLTLIDPWRPA
jgi:toxin FitB